MQSQFVYYYFAISPLVEALLTARPMPGEQTDRPQEEDGAVAETWLCAQRCRTRKISICNIKKL